MLSLRRAISSATTIAAAVALMTGASADGATKTVLVGDDFFDPAPMKIKERNTLAFKWVGTGEHNVYKKTGPGPYFQSDNFEGPGVHYSHKFKKPGNYVLACILHEDMLMDLKVKRR